MCCHEVGSWLKKDELLIEWPNSLLIEDFLNVKLEKVVDRYIAKTAEAKTDKGKGYSSVTIEYDREQKLSDKGENLPPIHNGIVHLTP